MIFSIRTDKIRENRGQHLLRPSPPSELAGVRPSRRRNRLQSVGHRRSFERAHVGYRGQVTNLFMKFF